MLNFKINEEKCTKCGLCAKECPAMIIELTPFPQIKEGKDTACLKCQHCLAICPTAALSILDKDPDDSISIPHEMPEAEALSNMMKTRRSVRKYKKTNLDKELINELLETASHAPTGHNDNGVHLTVVDNIETMDKVRQITYDAIKREKEAGRLAENLEFMYGFQKLWETKGIDVIFRGAPHFVIASVPEANVSPVPDGVIALTYFELLANSHGIGTLWNGMSKWAINDIAPDLKKTLGIPEDHVFTYAMTFGKPAVKFHRSVQSDGIHINSVEI